MSIPTFSRRQFLHVGAEALAAAALTGAFGCAPEKPLRIAVQPWIGYQFIFLAKLEGWLPLEGLQLLETTNTVDSVAALVDGRAEGAALTLDEVLRLRDQGIDLSIVLVFDVSAGADAVLAKPEIKTLPDLKGKRLAVETSSLGAVMLTKVLELGGLKREDLTIVPMSFDHFETWNNSKPDAIITYEPTLSKLLALGLVSVCDSRSLPQVLIDVLAVRPEAAERHDKILRKLIAGHFRALKLWQSNPIDTSYRLSTLVGVKPEEVKTTFKGLDLPDALYNRRYLTAPADELTQSAKEVAQIMTREGMLNHPLNLDHLILPDYLPREDE